MENITNNTSHIFNAFNQISDIIGNSVSGFIGIGIITNGFFLILLSNKSLKQKFYEDLWIKAFCDFIVCLIGVGHSNNSCINNCTYWAQFFNWYLIRIPVRLVFLASNISEIYLIFNRCIFLFNYRSKLLDIKNTKYYVLVVIYAFCISLAVPLYIGIEIEEASIPGKYMWGFSEFGRTKYFRNYFFAIFIVLSGLAVILMILLNFISIIKFHRVVYISNSMRERRNSVNDALENRFTKTTIIFSCLFIIIKSIDFYSNLQVMLYVSGEKLDFEQETIFNFIRQISLALNFSFHIFSSFLYIYMDLNLQKMIASILRKVLNCNQVLVKLFKKRTVNCISQIN